MYTLPNLFRPYIEGREAAIKENWQDLSNFNNVLKGQMENALYGETMGDAADRSHDQAAREHMNTVLAAANFPVGLQAASLGQYAQGTFGKDLIDAKLTNQLTGQRLAAQNNVYAMNLGQLIYNLQHGSLKDLNLSQADKDLLSKALVGIPQQPQQAQLQAPDQPQTPATETNPLAKQFNETNDELKKQQLEQQNQVQ